MYKQELTPGHWVYTTTESPPMPGYWISSFFDAEENEEPVLDYNCFHREWTGSTWLSKEVKADLGVYDIMWWKPTSIKKTAKQLVENEHAGSRSHYKDIIPGYEYMDIMEHVLGYDGVVAHLRGQIFKYLFRFGKKDAEGSESEKISWYANRLDDVVKRHAAGKFPIEIKQ